MENFIKNLSPIIVGVVKTLIAVLIPLSLFAQPSEFGFIPTNASGTMYGQATINGIEATSFDWVAAFDTNGNCAGAAALVVNAGLAYLNLPIYGDDVTSPDIDEGISSGEDFSLMLWDASTGQILPYPNSSQVNLFSGWANTNGAPIPVFNDVNVIYDFYAPASPVSLNEVGPLCVNSSPVELIFSPSGGDLSGSPGIINGWFEPSVAGIGSHTVFYILGPDTASITIEVANDFDSTILTTGPFCTDNSPVILEASTPGGSWAGPGTFEGTLDPSLLSPGTYWVTYSLGPTSDPCFASSTTELIIYPAATFYEVTICDPSAVPENEWEPCICVDFDSSTQEIQWFTSDGTSLEISSECLNSTNPTGNYYAEITNSYGCSVTTETFDFVNYIEEIALSESNLLLHFESSGTLVSNLLLEKITIFTSEGRIVSSEEHLNSRSYTLPDLSSGLYICFASSKYHWATIRVLR